MTMGTDLAADGSTVPQTMRMTGERFKPLPSASKTSPRRLRVQPSHQCAEYQRDDWDREQQGLAHSCANRTNLSAMSGI